MQSISEYIRKGNPILQPLAKDLRKIILSATPEIKENIKWNMPCYSVDGKNVCYFSIAKNHVTFGFYNATVLTDNDGLLEGTGRALRHVKISSKKEIRKTIFTKWVREASIQKIQK